MRKSFSFIVVGIVVIGLLGCKGPFAKNLPPAPLLAHPGPGVDGPGPGVMAFEPTQPIPPLASQILFVGPEGMQVTWGVTHPLAFDSEPLVCPGRYNFPQGGIYQLKLSNIPGRPGVELYPTLEVANAIPRTAAYLAHSAIPIQFTEEDFDQVLSGNFVTKVIYLPDPEFQELAIAGVETLVSTRLDPGVDPITEADNRGSILAIVRMGNKDLQLPTEMGGNGTVVTGMGGPMAANGALPGYVAGYTSPQWGMPITGTPIGLPGPPHVPLGAPAGLYKHTMVNHTWEHIPEPQHRMRIDVKQRPGFWYPRPANHAWVVERNAGPPVIYRQPYGIKHQRIGPDGYSDGTCPPQSGWAPTNTTEQ
ncbi:MAG: hypothetical protein NZ602_00380 [Thermoguttaceae bacterium]|nr:hypothetical protein [Thermoguttaceae bacterium]MDW8037021.1 hypothetical protein [Thermoguttaceae bacterium]